MVLRTSDLLRWVSTKKKRESEGFMKLPQTNIDKHDVLHLGYLTIMYFFCGTFFGPGSSHGFPFLPAQCCCLRVAFLDVAAEAADLGFLQHLRANHAKSSQARRPVRHQIVKAEPPRVAAAQLPLPGLTAQPRSAFWSADATIFADQSVLNKSAIAFWVELCVDLDCFELLRKDVHPTVFGAGL